MGPDVGTAAKMKTRPDVSPDRPDEDENIEREKILPVVPEMSSSDHVIPPFLVFIILPPKLAMYAMELLVIDIECGTKTDPTDVSPAALNTFIEFHVIPPSTDRAAKLEA